MNGSMSAIDLSDLAEGPNRIFFNNIFDQDINISQLNLEDLLRNGTDQGIGKVLDDFTEDFTKGDDQVSPLVFYLLSILYGIVIMIGISGNVMILYAIMSRGALRTARNFFIIILALSDLLLCVMTMPLTLWDVLSRKWPFGEDLEWLCQLAHSCQGTPVFMSSMAIVAIAADRYRCIMQPERPQFSTNTSIYLSIFMGVFAMILSLPMFFTARVRTLVIFPNGLDMENIFICQDTWEGSSKVVYTIVSSCAQFLLPFSVVIAIYLSIFFKLRNRPRSQHAENNNKRRRANMMIIAITLIFFVSWLPLNLFSFMIEIFPHVIRKYIEGSETVIYSLLHLFGLCNACINPILYGYLNENFRKEYKKIYRQMPWYSTSSHHQPAFHLHIVTPQQHEMITQTGLEGGCCNNNNSSTHLHGGAEGKPCLVITSTDPMTINPSQAASSILQAARRLSLAVIAPLQNDPEATLEGRSTKRHMTLDGLGEVSVETAFISHNSLLETKHLTEERTTPTDQTNTSAFRTGSVRGLRQQNDIDDDMDMNCEELNSLLRRDELHVIFVSGPRTEMSKENRVWRQLSAPGRSLPECANSGEPSPKKSFEYRREVGGVDDFRMTQNAMVDVEMGSEVRILSVGSFRSTVHRKFSIPGLFQSAQRSRPTKSEPDQFRSWPHRYLYMNWKNNFLSGTSGDKSVNQGSHPIDLDGLEETPV
ncbi:hypothetical protein TCAL_06016 [Tigriopus californicus]|uniref:G-protein coupled receptors family 1 profile domain-containing protein n=1 Tax=Tigriopus californicus TaxID=6832 RepID=A0A553P6Q5_TIGCA|nr:D(1)-like dopamine receptor [Tigriopus californicus]TRY73362.1 hypothetical protein TCAL_06016 [Tigriopus californicus]